MTKLRHSRYFNDEVLYNQNEHAEELYFIFEGQVSLRYDLMQGEANPFMI